MHCEIGSLDAMLDDGRDDVRAYFAALSGRRLDPVQRLMLALLERNCLDLSLKSQRWSALSWFVRDDGRWVFSFDSCCDHLGLNTEYVRAGVLARFGAREKIAIGNRVNAGPTRVVGRQVKGRRQSRWSSQRSNGAVAAA